MYSLLTGLYTSTLPPPLTLLILGLDSSGKTTFLTTLKTSPTLNPPQTRNLNKFTGKAGEPTKGANICKLRSASKAALTLYDVGGSPSLRKLWSHYYIDCDAVILIIDGSDLLRIEEAGLVVENVWFGVKEGKSGAGKRRGNTPFAVISNVKSSNDSSQSSDYDSYITSNELRESFDFLPLGGIHSSVEFFEVDCERDVKGCEGVVDWCVRECNDNEKRKR